MKVVIKNNLNGKYFTHLTGPAGLDYGSPSEPVMPEFGELPQAKLFTSPLDAVEVMNQSMGFMDCAIVHYQAEVKRLKNPMLDKLERVKAVLTEAANHLHSKQDMDRVREMARTALEDWR